MKTIYFSNAFGKVVKIVSFIAAFILDTISCVLTPITWIKFKGHIVLAAIAALCGTYFYFFKHLDKAFIFSAIGFICAVLVIAFIKKVRLCVYKLGIFFMRIYDCPIGVYVTVKFMPFNISKHRNTSFICSKNNNPVSVNS